MPLSKIVQNSVDTPVVGTGPAFSAYMGSTQSISLNTWTKLQFNTEQFDTNNNFDPTTNYRFTPTVAGYYYVNVQWTLSVNAVQLVGIYKNGSGYLTTQNVAGCFDSCVSGLVYMNGTTDYIEGYGYCTSSVTANATSTRSVFSAVMVRAA